MTFDIFEWHQKYLNKNIVALYMIATDIAKEKDHFYSFKIKRIC